MNEFNLSSLRREFYKGFDDRYLTTGKFNKTAMVNDLIRLIDDDFFLKAEILKSGEKEKPFYFMKAELHLLYEINAKAGRKPYNLGFLTDWLRKQEVKISEIYQAVIEKITR